MCADVFRNAVIIGDVAVAPGPSIPDEEAMLEAKGTELNNTNKHPINDTTNMDYTHSLPKPNNF